jgi:bifunctional non-homologous end joining protein LigD
LPLRFSETEHPDEVVSRMQKALRKGKVLIDWSQNDEHKTTICVYSLRAKEPPTVSTPVTWQEVEMAVKNGDGSRLIFDSAAALDRAEKQADLFAPVLSLKQRLPNLQSIGLVDAMVLSGCRICDNLTDEKENN